MSVISRKKFISSYGVALLNSLPSTSLFHLNPINLHVIFICLFVFWISKNVPIGPSSDPFQDAVSYSPPFSPWGRTKYLKSSPHLWEVTQQTSSGVLLCFRGFVVAGFGGLFLSFALGILPLLFVKPVSLPCSSAPHSTSLPSDISTMLGKTVFWRFGTALFSEFPKVHWPLGSSNSLHFAIYSRLLSARRLAGSPYRQLWNATFNFWTRKQMIIIS